jgi:hypothetical protein
MLSALVQGEAAIVALVVTLSLVAVQLAAQSYSARVIEVFRRTPDLWILMGIYSVAIFYGLGVLKLINQDNISDFEIYISSAYYFGIFAFVALVPYMLKMFEMLKPSTVIDMLAEKITKENILSSIDKEKPEKDPILPIIDIVRGSMMKYDTETVIDGLNVIGESTSCIFENETLSEDEEKEISEHVFNHLTRVGKLAISREDEVSTQQVITNLGENGITAAEQELKEAVWEAIRNINFIGTSAAENKLEASTEKTASYLEQIGKASVEKNLKIKSKEAGCWEAIYLKEIGVKAAEYKMENAVNVVLDSLGGLGSEAAKHNLKNTTLKIIAFIVDVRMEAAKKQLEGTKTTAVDALRWILSESNGELEINQKIKEAFEKLK